MGEQPGKAAGHDAGKPVAQRRQEPQEDGSGDQKGQGPRKDDPQVFGHPLVDEVEDDREEPHRKDDREQRALVVVSRDINEAEGIAGDPFGRGREGGVHQNAGGHQAEYFLDAEPLGRCIARHKGHEVEGGVADGAQNRDDIRVGGSQPQRGDQRDDAFDHTAGHDGVKVGSDTGGQGVQPADDEVLFLLLDGRGVGSGIRSVRLDLAAGVDPRNGDEVVVHLRHRGADDALDLPAGFHHFEDTLDAAQFGHVHQIPVDRHDPQPGDAVEHVGDILTAAHRIEDGTA